MKKAGIDCSESSAEVQTGELIGYNVNSYGLIRDHLMTSLTSFNISSCSHTKGFQNQ